MARPGTLDQRVTFQSESVTTNARGGRDSTGWSDIATAPTVWARVERAQGAEEESADRVQNRYVLTVTIRNRDDLDERMRLNWRGRAYNIRSIEPYDHRAMYRTMTAEGGVAL
jgi:SPP1 family predicted phage head-tail adaptor